MAEKYYTSAHSVAHCSQYNPDSFVCQNCCCSYVDIEETIIFQECHAFYTVFLQLEKQLEGSGIHNNKPDELPTLFSVPYVVNGAFACELALKYLLISSNTPFNMKKGHDLEYLFKILPQVQRDILTSLIKKRSCLDDNAFQEGLHSIADIFIKQRYQFNNYDENHTPHELLNSFIHTLCEFVLKKEDKPLVDDL